MIDFRWGLPLGALGLYLYDTVLRLFDNEVVFFKLAQRWRASAGSNFVLLGKRIVWIAPGAPWAIVVRSSWPMSSDIATSVAPTLDPAQVIAVRPLRWICSALLALLVVALPTISLLDGRPSHLLALFAVYYVGILSALGVMIARRGALQLTPRALMALALDVVCCAPFAVNLVRKITAGKIMTGGALQFAQAHLDADDNAALTQIIHVRAAFAADSPSAPARPASKH